MGKNINPAIVLSFANQKGGVGKSTITAIFANYVYKTGKEQGTNLSIAVIDADDKQQTLYRKRNREKQAYQVELEEKEGELTALKESKVSDADQIVKLEKEILDIKEILEFGAFSIIPIQSSDVADQMEILKEQYDIILLDLPGNIKQEGVITSYYMADIFIMPFMPTENDLDSTFLYHNYLMASVVKDRKELGFNTEVYGIFNRVKTNTLEFQSLYEGRDNLPFQTLEYFIKDSVRYSRNQNTIGTFDADSTDVCDEILGLIIAAQKKK